VTHSARLWLPSSVLQYVFRRPWGKQSDGALRVVTPLGPGATSTFLFFSEFIWSGCSGIFAILRQQVLRSRQQKMIDRLCTSHASFRRNLTTDVNRLP
jgi:hypothetical protein